MARVDDDVRARYIERLAPYIGAKILEVGAGTGEVAEAICEQFSPELYLALEVRDRLAPHLRSQLPDPMYYVITTSRDARYNPTGTDRHLPDGHYDLIHAKSWATHVPTAELHAWFRMFVDRTEPGAHVALTLFVGEHADHDTLHTFHSGLDAIYDFELVEFEHGDWHYDDPPEAPGWESHDFAVWRRV